MDAATRDRVRRRAQDRCEYCRLPQQHSTLKHHIEHIVAKQHGGSDELDNLALACHRCNLHKGPNLTGIDSTAGEVVPLYHPRSDEWNEHFRGRGAYLEGLTPIGRATVRLLAINDPRRVDLRTEILARGQMPY